MKCIMMVFSFLFPLALACVLFCNCVVSVTFDPYLISCLIVSCLLLGGYGVRRMAGWLLVSDMVLLVLC